jgi:tripartite-type tricarboxylate transporter receptor subunit TctC
MRQGYTVSFGQLRTNRRENRPGAASNLAAEAVVRAPPDGHTLLLVTSVNAINAMLYDNLNFDLIPDIAPVASIARGPGVMEVNPMFPAKSVPEFIAYAKANPGKINMATAGSGSMLDVYGQLFMMMAGVDMVRVPYRGAPPALTDLIGGRVQVVFDTFAASIELVRAGKLRALAVTTATRSPALPDIPSLGDFLPGYDASTWLGIGAPKNTPPDIVKKLNKEIDAALVDPSMKARIADFGYTAFASSPAEFGKFIAEETEKWGKVIRAANIKPD